MAEVLPTGTNLNTVRSAGDYLVLNPVGLSDGSYRLWVYEGPDADGSNYCVQELLNLRNSYKFIRSEIESGFTEWISVLVSSTVEDKGLLYADFLTTGSDPVEAAPTAETLYTVTTGGTEGAETIELSGEGAFLGMRMVIRLGTKTHVDDSVVIDDTLLIVGDQVAGTAEPFDDVYETPYALETVGDAVVLEWGGDGWYVKYAVPVPTPDA